MKYIFLFIFIFYDLSVLATKNFNVDIEYSYLYRFQNPLNQDVGNAFFHGNFNGNDQLILGREINYKLSTRYYVEGKSFLFSMGELYYKIKINNKTLYVGRKLVNWNSLDNFWGENYLNSRRGFNYFDFNEEGLTGIHGSHYFNENLKINFIISYLFIPQVNPGFRIDNGNIIGSNEWSKLPPDKVEFRGKTIPIEYNLISPRLDEIIFRPTIGVNLVKTINNVSNISIYFLYKPENSIRLSASGQFDQEVESKAVVKAMPFVNMHTLLGLNYVSIFKKNVTFALGMQGVFPSSVKITNINSDNLTINPYYYDKLLLKSSLSYNNKELLIAVYSSMLIVGANEIEDEVFYIKPKWKYAIGGIIDYSFKKLERVNIFSYFKYDYLTYSFLSETKLRYEVNNKLFLSFGIQYIKSGIDQSFWSTYKFNDVFYSNLTYSF